VEIIFQVIKMLKRCLLVANNRADALLFASIKNRAVVENKINSVPVAFRGV